MIVLNKKVKIIFFAAAFALIAAIGYASEYFENDAFIEETEAVEDDLPYSSTAQGEKNGQININAAQADEFEKLNGIGAALAERIIKYRSENGPFATKEEIMKVSGIGAQKYEDFKDNIYAE